jgi:hypothetical protein
MPGPENSWWISSLARWKIPQAAAVRVHKVDGQARRMR